MFAAFTHHLGTACISFYRHTTHWAPFNIIISSIRPSKRVRGLPSSLHQGGSILCTREPWVPSSRAKAAKLLLTSWAAYWDTLGFSASTDMTDSVTASRGTPGPGSIHRYFCVQSESSMFVQKLLICHPLHLVLVHHSLCRTLRVRGKYRKLPPSPRR